jgi:transcriptional regulator GlxA family with amidase domain
VIRITLLALPDALASSLSLPMEMFTAADQLARAANRHSARQQLVVAGPEQGDVSTSSGLTVRCDRAWQQVEETDLLILPALWRNPMIHLRRYHALLPWLRRLSQGDTLLCAVGTSSFFLAEAGLLDGRPATTHWSFLDQFARRYPAVQLKRHHLITGAGTIYCAGSVNSVADLTIHFIGLFYGHSLAHQVEAQFSPEIRRSFESRAFSAEHHSDELVVQAQEWLRRHAAEAVQLGELAQRLGISLRTLDRRFRSATGTTPQGYLQQRRLDTARDLLRTTDLDIREIAAAVGYGDSGYFARQFRSAMQQTPRQYRQAVRRKLFEASPTQVGKKVQKSTTQPPSDNRSSEQLPNLLRKN